jgi:hypothetical protein
LQLEVEKFINACYVGLEVGAGHLVNPFMDSIWVKQETGLLSKFTNSALFDVTADAAVYDVAGAKFKVEDLFVIRTNEQSQITAAAPMFSVHAQIDEYEHLFIFKNYVEDSTETGLLYDAFSGSGVVTYKFNSLI